MAGMAGRDRRVRMGRGGEGWGKKRRIGPPTFWLLPPPMTVKNYGYTL